jgi:hypothetical protein
MHQNMIDFIYSTTSGLYRHTNNNTTQLSCGDYFGITRIKPGLWAAANRSDECLELHDLENQSIQKIYGLVTKQTHQIDVIQDMLYLVNTDQNCILTTDMNFKVLHKFFPNGPAERGDKNFCHFNSVYCNGESIYIIAHNLGEITGKNSELYVIDKNHNVKEKLNLGCFSCHNIIIKDDETFICYSKDSSIKQDRTVIYNKEGFFTRGLSIGDSFIYGYNKVSKISGERIGCVSINRASSETIIIVGEPVNEIRQIEFDFGISKDANTRNNVSSCPNDMPHKPLRKIIC